MGVLYRIAVPLEKSRLDGRRFLNEFRQDLCSFSVPAYKKLQKSSQLRAFLCPVRNGILSL